MKKMIQLIFLLVFAMSASAFEGQLKYAKILFSPIQVLDIQLDKIDLNDFSDQSGYYIGTKSVPMAKIGELNYKIFRIFKKGTQSAKRLFLKEEQTGENVVLVHERKGFTLVHIRTQNRYKINKFTDWK